LIITGGLNASHYYGFRWMTKASSGEQGISVAAPDDHGPLLGELSHACAEWRLTRLSPELLDASDFCCGLGSSWIRGDSTCWAVPEEP